MMQIESEKMELERTINDKENNRRRASSFIGSPLRKYTSASIIGKFFFLSFSLLEMSLFNRQNTIRNECFWQRHYGTSRQETVDVGEGTIGSGVSQVTCSASRRSRRTGSFRKRSY